MQQIEYAGSLKPSAKIERSAYSYLGLSRIPELRGTCLKLRVSGSDEIYYASITGPDGRFAGELYFPMDPDVSYKRVLREGMMQIGGVCMPIMRRSITIEDEKAGARVDSRVIEVTTAGGLWESVRECTPSDICLLIQTIEFRLDTREGAARAADACTASEADDVLMKRAAECVKLNGLSARLLADALANAENFHFYLTGKKPV